MKDFQKRGFPGRSVLVMLGMMVIVAGGISSIAVGIQSSTTSLIGRPAPAFTLQNLEGKIISSSVYKGKVVVLDFWATWCGPCRMEIPSFITLQKKYEKKGFTFIGVSVDENGPAIVADFAKKNGMNYPQLMASYEVITRYGSFEAIPTTFVIDRKGVIRKVLQGYHPQSVFESEIQKLLGEK
jgi:thiol-disulfide isomerase/thioredoxin